MYCAIVGGKTETYLLVSMNIFLEYSSLFNVTPCLLVNVYRRCEGTVYSIFVYPYENLLLFKNYISFMFIKYNVLCIFVLPGDGRDGRNLLY